MTNPIVKNNEQMLPLRDTFIFRRHGGEWMVEHSGAVGHNSTHTGRVAIVPKANGGEGVVQLGKKYELYRSGRRTTVMYAIAKSFLSEEQACEYLGCPAPGRRPRTFKATISTADPPRGRIQLC